MVGMATVDGGTKHGLAALSHEERQAAHNALAKLNSRAGLGSHLDAATRSATVYGGSLLKSAGLNASSMMHGSDTFIGGARSGLTHAGVGNDTVVSGSTATFGGRAALSGPIGHHEGQHINLSSDTISVAGHTAEGVKAGHTHDAASSHTITLADNTKVTITGVAAHDIKPTH
jgi:hypothetical protein